jgi:cytoskeleton protein RodZ
VFDIGASLAAARKAEGLRLADAERLTCLRGKYLSALEHNDFGSLPGRVYARAFLRTYADVLGLDPDLLVDEFDEQVPEPVEDELTVVLPRVKRPFPMRLAVVAVCAAGFVGVLAWAGFTNAPSNVHTPLAPKAASAAPPPVHHAAPPVHHATPAAKPALLSIRAVSGTCWVQVRKGGANGPVLYEGDVYPGQTLHFAPRVWMRLGAPWNVVVHRGSHAVAVTSQSAPENLVA